jgi:Flp pilus assembly protein TadG
MMKTRSNHKTSGQACVELALVLPVLLLLLAGVYDFACAIRASNTISNMSREGASLASRSSVGAQDIMNALAVTAQSLDMKNNGMMFLSVVQGTATAGQPKIISQTGWQNGKYAASSRITASTPNLGLGTLKLDASKTVYVVEVIYNYQGLFPRVVTMLYGQLYAKAIF